MPIKPEDDQIMKLLSEAANLANADGDEATAIQIDLAINARMKKIEN